MHRFSALGDPTRLRIVEMLATNGQLPATDIRKQFTISAPAISQHLKVLRNANLVQVEARAQQRIYSLNPQTLADMAEWTTTLQRQWLESYERLEATRKNKQKDKRSEPMPTFTITRQFNAPRQKVWDAWTKPELLAQWFGPKGFKSTIKHMDVTPGGSVHTCLTGPDGSEMWGKFEYREVTPPSRLTWEHGFSDEHGNRTRHPFSAEWPLVLWTTLTLTEKDGGTELVLTWTPHHAEANEIATFAAGFDSMNQGWGGTFEQLETFLKT